MAALEAAVVECRVAHREMVRARLHARRLRQQRVVNDAGALNAKLLWDVAVG